MIRKFTHQATREEKSPSDASSGIRTRSRLTRLERSVEARKSIFEAAAKVVGKYGYADASIARITEAAGIAQGTFYLYFESRQKLFDELLPHCGEDMLHFIRDRIYGVSSVYEMEERGFRAFFAYLKGNPGFFRILNEAEVASPIAHKNHFNMLSEHYVESLQRAVTSGEIRNYASNELETVAYMFMAARSYFYLRYVKNNLRLRALPEKVVQTYMKLVRDGLK